MLKLIGKGSFGVVYKAYDHKYGRYVALKMVRNERRFHRQAQEEIKILEYLRRIDHRNEFNVIHIYDHFLFRQQMFITFELLYINLFELIRKNKFCGFSIQVVRKFAHSLLICLNALHSQKIIHCDLKPENILLKQQGRSGIKVIDFGSSCFEDQRIYTYIQSRFYRAPEVILGAKYGMAIDMWSLGCILVELLTGYVLFPGEDESDQLALVIEALDMPPKDLLERSKRTKNFFTPNGLPRYCNVRQLKSGEVELQQGFSRRGKPRGVPGSRSLERIVQVYGNKYFLNFLRRCLEWDPAQRMTPAEGLRHSWFRRRLPRPANESSTPDGSPATGGGSAPLAGPNSVTCATSMIQQGSSSLVNLASSTAALATNAVIVATAASSSASGATTLGNNNAAAKTTTT